MDVAREVGIVLEVVQLWDSGSPSLGSPSLDAFKTCLDTALSSLTRLWSAHLLQGWAGDLQASLPT